MYNDTKGIIKELHAIAKELHNIADTKAKIDRAYAEGYKMAKFDIEQSTIDIVLCAECKWYKSDGCFFSTAEVKPTDYCSYGERK